MARLKLDSLLPEWDPRTPTVVLPPQEEEDREDLVTFRGPPPIKSLTEGFRIFTKERTVLEPEILGPANEALRLRDNQITISVAGASIHSGEAHAQAGAGVQHSTENPRNKSLRIPEDFDQNASAAEVTAAIVALQQVAPDTRVRIETARPYILKAVSKNLEQWEDKGWTGVPNRKPMQTLVTALRERTAPTTIAVVPGSSSVGEAVGLAREGAGKAVPDVMDQQTRPEFELRGAKLSTLTQAMAYRAIKQLRNETHRKTTDENILAIQAATTTLYKKNPKAAAIWKSIRNPDISRQIRNFLWKTIHGAHRVGKFWLNIPEMEERATCQHCGVIESMEHILLECTRPGQKEVWQLAEKLWLLNHTDWPAVSFGGMLGCGLATFKDENGKNSPPTTRLFRIIMTESMHLIWKLRCDCVIARDGEPPTLNEIHNKWVAIINERLTIDRALTNRVKFGKQHSLPPSLVLDTWKGSLLDEDKLPKDWLRDPEVLVGIVPMRSRRSPSPPVGRRGRNR
ncbi:hypothetical protein DFH06DRAFT_1016813 [Mycena polygramma]|nr:hypothetical protein DFH06DRAFT_1016813 [Mycena polygramma]